jgi:hypothetical protein
MFLQHIPTRSTLGNSRNGESGKPYLATEVGEGDVEGGAGEEAGGHLPQHREPRRGRELIASKIVAGSARICSPLGETRGGGEIGDEADAFLRFGRGPGLHQVLLPMGQKQRKTTVQKQQDLVLKKKKKSNKTYSSLPWPIPIHRSLPRLLSFEHCYMYDEIRPIFVRPWHITLGLNCCINRDHWMIVSYGIRTGNVVCAEQFRYLF